MNNIMLTGSKGLQPSNISEALQLADMLSKSSIVPKDYQGNPGNVFVAMQWGAEIGLAPMQAMQNIAVINGRPSIWGDAMLALVRGSGLLEYIHEDPTAEGCTVKIKRKGEEEVVRSFTLEDARKAGLASKQGPWTQYPKRMMQMRARSIALRDVFADVLKGIHSAEEAMDMPSERDMGAVEEVKAEEKPAKKSSRKDAAKSHLAITDKTAEQNIIPAVDLQSLIDRLATVQTMDELQAVAEDAKHLVDEGEKEILRGKYRERKSELTSPTVIDGDGVVHTTDDDPVYVTDDDLPPY